MIEAKIDSLINSIDQLTAVIDRLWQQKDEIKGTGKPETPKPATKTAEVPKVKDLENFCLTLVRDKPETKNKIKKTIKQFGGSLIKDIAPEKLPELKDALEALAA